jgi:hypothetical protein
MAVKVTHFLLWDAADDDTDGVAVISISAESRDIQSESVFFLLMYEIFSRSGWGRAFQLLLLLRI